MEYDWKGGQGEQTNNSIISELILFYEIGWGGDESSEGVGSCQIWDVLFHGAVGEVGRAVVVLEFVTVQHLLSLYF